MSEHLSYDDLYVINARGHMDRIMATSANLDKNSIVAKCDTFRMVVNKAKNIYDNSHGALRTARARVEGAGSRKEVFSN